VYQVWNILCCLFFSLVAYFGWEFPVYNVSEAKGSVEICAVLVGILRTTVPIINVFFQTGTATREWRVHYYTSI
jgi:hypothetical protein